jgi:dienelactone hydrolase
MREMSAARAFLFCLCAASAAHGQELPRERRIQLDVPGADKVFVERNLPYKRAAEGGAELRFDIYYPPDFAQDTALPALVFVNGVGFPELKDAPEYVSWARATAAIGLAAVTFESTQTSAEADIEDLMAYLRGNATTLGIDGENMGWWMCSSNVARSLPLALQAGRKYLRCCVVYYGMADITYWGQIRDDMPLFVVKAGLDWPLTNENIDRFVAEASRQNRDLTYVVYASGRHAFDVFDDTQRTRTIIQDTLDFMRLQLSPKVQLEVEQTALLRAGNAAYKNQDWVETVKVYAHVVAQQPNYGEGHFRLGFGQLYLGMFDQAIGSFERSLELGYFCPASSYNIACSHARRDGLGDRDKAFEWLDRAVEIGFADYGLLKSDPDLSNLRGDPRFAKVLERVGAQRKD